MTTWPTRGKLPRYADSSTINQSPGCRVGAIEFPETSNRRYRRAALTASEMLTAMTVDRTNNARDDGRLRSLHPTGAQVTFGAGRTPPLRRRIR